MRRTHRLVAASRDGYQIVESGYVEWPDDASAGVHKSPGGGSRNIPRAVSDCESIRRGTVLFALTSGYTDRDRNGVALKTGVYVFIILVFFLFLGRFVLNFFGLTLPVLRIAGGLIVAHSAWQMVTGSSRVTAAEGTEAEGKEDISLTPMAMPMLSGPGSIGVVMGLAATTSSWLCLLGMVIGIAGLALVVFLFLRLGGPLVGRLGPTATGAINRIFGFLILAIAVQLIWDGVAQFQFNG